MDVSVGSKKKINARMKKVSNILYSPERLREELYKSGFKNLRIMNPPLFLFGQSRLAKLLIKSLYKFSPIEQLSAASNYLAQKPQLIQKTRNYVSRK